LVKRLEDIFESISVQVADHPAAMGDGDGSGLFRDYNRYCIADF
jgi:hypothetical protein